MAKSSLLFLTIAAMALLFGVCKKEVENANPEDTGKPTAQSESKPEETKEPARIEMGRLTVRTEPCSSVYVDGEFVDDTPLVGFEISSGDHNIALDCRALGIRREYTVTIKPGTTTLLIKKL